MGRDLGTALIRDQFPQWSDRNIEAYPLSGTVNAIFRIGTDLAARFPLRPGDPEVMQRNLEDEAEAVEEFSSTVSFAAPVPVAIGQPGADYPLPWNIQTWVPGASATPDSIASSDMAAKDISTLILHLRSADAQGRTFCGEGRGGKLPDHDQWMNTCFDKSSSLMNVGPLRALWAELRELPDGKADVMSHGDLIPQNILISHGRISGVIDTGSFGPADPALDLIAAWHLFDPPRRDAVRTQVGCADVEWQRSAAWAFQQAMGLVWYYAETNPAMAALGLSTLRRIQETSDWLDD